LFTIYFFKFFSTFDIFFFSILPIYGIQKIVTFCVVLLYGSEILSKN